MAKQINIEEFLIKSVNIPIIDVRTPAEFEHAHIPGAVNIPLFTNEERAIVGTNYKKNGKENAVLAGLEFVGPKLADFARLAKKTAVDNKLLIHCWRGGMRSASMAWLFETVGLEIETLSGGYKSYRRHIKSKFAENYKIVVLGGMTGSGKTEILKEIEKLGEQFVDLEGIANHKGSAFGSFGEKKQTSTEQFENNLFEYWKKIDPNKYLWLEDESQSIGYVRIPEEIYIKIRNSIVVEISVPKAERIKWLVEEYANFDKKLLESAVLKISKRLGGLNTKLALDAITEGKFDIVADITLQYYDKAYQYGLSKRENKILKIGLDKIDHKENAKKIIAFFNTEVLHTLNLK
ncbi:MAG: tRNA 2-selenouridine(34) synthase MnmH [Bacteroidales bacterium]|nr:tRNA 2-selenouridine(34) synthase MnmH [Bacteroidales bacterium]MBN2757693.1 tRNA 2-selenouridine(34) synthase MnmH [Bacteroidales bacterium]